MKISFLKEIKKCISVADFFCIQLYSSGGIVFCVKKILECDEQKIILITQNKKRVIINGEKLTVTKVNEGDLFFTGQIKGVEVE